MKDILKVLVGSQAHGLANEDSDFDYRAVFMEPTSKILELNSKTKGSTWVEGNEDNTAWELAHFLHLATKCNPTIMEVFHAPITEVDDPLGIELINLFPHVWNKEGVFHAHLGYGNNQQKKFRDNKDGKWKKYACAWLRTTYQAFSLFEYGTYPVDFTDTPLYEYLKEIRSEEDKINRSHVFWVAETWETHLKEAYAKYPEKQTNYEPINEFLLKARRGYWND